jgi:hypothetical protein
VLYLPSLVKISQPSELFWIGLYLIVVALVELLASLGWLPPERLLPPWVFGH